ncbi:MAG: alanine:cation symporter family protein, partial [Deinococcales bacterium]
AAWQGMSEAIPAETVTAVFSSLGGDNEQFAQLGRAVFAFVVTLFAIATTIAWSLYAEEAFGHLFGDGMRWSLRLVWVGVVFLAPFIVVDYGAFLSNAEYLLALMAIPNIVALLGLMPAVRQLTKDFFRGEPYSPPDLPMRYPTKDGFESMEFTLD